MPRYLGSSISRRSYSSLSSNTLIDHCYSVMGEKASVTGKQLNHFSSPQPHDASGPYTVNTNRWLTGFDLTCKPVYSNGVITNGRGCLITPRHLISASHWGYSVGNTIYFVNSSGTLLSRTVSDISTQDYDIEIVLLSSDLPATVTPAKLFDEDLADWIPTAALSISTGVPCFAYDKDGNVITRRYYGRDNQPTVGGELFQHYQYTEGLFSEYTQLMPPGDSGSPIMMTGSGEAVLCATGYNQSYGWALHARHDEINAGIADVGANGHAFDTIDISGFDTL